MIGSRPAVQESRISEHPSPPSAELEPTARVVVDDYERFRELCGRHFANLKAIEQVLPVRVTARGDTISLRGDPEPVEAARDLLEQFAALAAQGHRVSSDAVFRAAMLAARGETPRLDELYADVILSTNRGRDITPRSPNQKRYVDAIRRCDVVFGLGPAGTGKTYLAVAMAVAALQAGHIRRIVLCRPAVEAGEKLGFLPGDLADKVDPYLRPLYDALHDMVEPGKAARLFEQGTIEIAPLAFMRGRTLNKAFVILDEAQNTTPQQMKMFLTRLGSESKAVVTGDITQVDLPGEQRSGLAEVRRILRGIREIPFIELTPVDVLRHPLVQRIVEAYDRAERDADATGGERGPT